LGCKAKEEKIKLIRHMFRLHLFIPQGSSDDDPTGPILVGNSGLLFFWTLFIVWYSKNTQNNATFRKQIQFPKRCVILCILEHQTMDKVQEPNNPYRYTPSSESFRIYNMLGTD
jgi:hypothetical protein